MKLLLDPNPGGGGGTDWKATLPEDLRASPSLADIQDIPSLAKSFVNAQSLIGRKRLPLPEKNWGDKEWDDLYGQLGRPQTPDKYGVPEFQFEEGLSVAPELVDKAKLQFHKLGLSERQAKGILEFYFGMENDRYKETKGTSTSERSAAEEALKKQYGDKYDSKLALAKSAIAKFGDQEGQFLKYLDESKLGNDPRLVAFLVKVAETLNEDSTGNPGSSLPIPDKEKAKLEIANLKMDKEFMDAFLKGSKPHVDKWNELHSMAFRT